MRKLITRLVIVFAVCSIIVGCESDGGSDDSSNNSGSVRLTRAEYDEIKLGMSYDQVSAIVYPCPKFKDYRDRFGRHVIWEDNDEGVIWVNFYNGLVKSTGYMWLAQEGRP